jgi:hypothetical protein
MREVVVVIAAFALLGVTAWAPYIAVVEVDVAGEGIGTKELVSSTAYSSTGSRPITYEESRPVKCERVVAHLGRRNSLAPLKPSIGEARIDWTRVLAEYALILATAAFTFALMPGDRSKASAVEGTPPPPGGSP